MQNLLYALAQVIHNFGAATVVGSAASALWLVRGNAVSRHRLAILAAVAWAAQAASGALFGATTYYFENHLPDIHGVAIDALLIKIVCAVAGFILALVWRAMLAAGVVALASAAFLRWFS